MASGSKTLSPPISLAYLFPLLTFQGFLQHTRDVLKDKIRETTRFQELQFRISRISTKPPTLSADMSMSSSIVSILPGDQSPEASVFRQLETMYAPLPHRDTTSQV